MSEVEAKAAEQKAPERVVCAAIRHRTTLAIICGPRHYDETMMAQIQALPDDWRYAEQGFVNQFGEFLTRERAYEIATLQGQIFRELDHSRGLLFSEHLY